MATSTPPGAAAVATGAVGEEAGAVVAVGGIGLGDGIGVEDGTGVPGCPQAASNTASDTRISR